MKVWHYGDDVNTDMLFPGKYTYTCSTADEIRPHLLEDLDPAFARGVAPGDVILAGRNFGCGSSREQPVVGLAAVGLAAVVAGSFARIFYRAAINQGLLLVECPAAVAAYTGGQTVELDPVAGRIRVGSRDGFPNETESGGAVEFEFAMLPAEILAIRDAGGLLPFTVGQLERNRR